MNELNESGPGAAEQTDRGYHHVSMAGVSHLRNAVRVPGFHVAPIEIDRRTEDLLKRLAVFYYKKDTPCLWISFMGGTGTGKSTLFNAFCGTSLSQTGVERPKTGGPIAYAHQNCRVAPDFPFTDVSIDPRDADDFLPGGSVGAPGHLALFIHHRDEQSHLVILDTPDMDSVEAQNAAAVDAFYLLSDAVVFVTSQDKYADEIPYQFLLNISKDQKPCFLLVNKTHGITKQEILSPIQSHGAILAENRVWLIGYHLSGDEGSVLNDPGFSEFAQALSEDLSPERAHKFHAEEQTRRSTAIAEKAEALTDLIGKERQEATKWVTELGRLYDAACADLIEAEKERFTSESRRHLQSEIRRLFERYDPLSKPRKVIRRIISLPFQFAGMSLGRRPKRKDALSQVRRQIDLTPVLASAERFNRFVLERLSPERKDSPLLKAIHQPDMPLTETEIRSAMSKEHDKLDRWLEKKFKDLSRRLPTHKRWGIYSTSILWGTLILSFQIVVGGGFSGLDAILDSVLAPFITKGSMELFAYREIKAVAKALAQQYQEALCSILERQKQRYEKALLDLLTKPEDLATLKALQEEMEAVR